MIVGLTRGQWRALRDATGPGPQLDKLAARLGLDFDAEGDRFRARREIARIFNSWFASRMLAEIRTLFDAGNVCWAPYRTMRQVVEKDPDCTTANPMFALVEQPGIGTYLMPGTPFEFGAVPRQPAVRAPRLGEHTDEILTTVLGLSDAEIATLHDDGIVAGPD
jgi:2-methylfumaryl-CoA isomerase